MLYDIILQDSFTIFYHDNVTVTNVTIYDSNM